MKSTNIESSTASILVDIGAVIFRPKQPFEYKSGILSPVYTDNRLLISFPEKWNKVINYFVETIATFGKPDVVAGVATAGVPHAALVAQRLKIPMIYARPVPKGHGLDKQVEGVVKKGQNVLVVDDLISTGMSSLGVIEGIRKLGAKVTDQVAIFSYELEDAKQNYQKAKVKLHPLTTLEHAAEAARKKGLLKVENIEIIMDWASDPHNWAKRQGFK